MPRVGQLVRVDAQLGVGVRGERVMRGQFRASLVAVSTLAPLAT